MNLQVLFLLLGLYFLLPKLRKAFYYIKLLAWVNRMPLLKRYHRASLEGPWALVTGCTSGMGEELCYRLGKEGFNLVLVSRSEQKLQQVQEKILAQSPTVKVKYIVADLCKEALDLDMYQKIAAEVAGLDLAIVVNNAGVLYNGYYKNTSADNHREVTIINTYPYILLTRALLPQLKARKTAKTTIVNMASLAGFGAQPYAMTYSATKAFDLSFSEALRKEIAGEKYLEVLTVCPMIVKTSMTKNATLDWTSGAVTSTQYIDYLTRCLSSKEPLGIVAGPFFHTTQTVVYSMLLEIFSNTRWLYQFIHDFTKKAAH